MAVGSVIRSKVFQVRDIDAIVSAIVVFITCNVLLLLSAILPNSPLLAVTGRVFPSPWSHGLFQSLCLECILISIVFGLVAGTIRNWHDALNLLTYGISRWPWTILLTLLLSLIFNDK
jgi:aminobenzoyl-glutamate transport protein